MDSKRRILFAVVGILMTGLVAYSLIGGNTSPQRLSDKSGVLFAAPPGYAVFEANITFADGDYSTVARRIDEILAAANTEKPQIALHIDSGNSERYFMVDFAGDRLEERAQSPVGTVTQRVWNGRIGERLQNALHSGSLVPGKMSGPIEKNLYH